MNSFGSLFRVQIYGESHGPGVGIIIDGIPPGIPLSVEDFKEDLSKRKPGKIGTTKRIEEDSPIFLSGIFNDFTTGAPLNIFFQNNNTNSKVYADFKSHPRPGHSDFSAVQKYDSFNDMRGGGHFSGRLTLGLVAAGVIAKKILKKVTFNCEIDSIGTLNKEDFNIKLKDYLEVIEKDGDSLGGIISLSIKDIPIGLGEPFFESVESKISSMVFSIPGIKGIEFGAGFEGTKLLGSKFNDLFIDKNGRTTTNNNGGINGGITNGNDIYLKVAVKPTSSIFKSQDTYNFKENKISTLNITGRHDVAFILRVPIVLENSVAIALADLYLQSKKIQF
ncbi:chorismate synthase [Cetobacterium sp. 8H]|uniref:chorismate synthase n=1 Tax=Cetobacterium sp. 8H TaxID=2759681 RepID=UPI00163BE4F6|nr:chorismate synthase [Cetobacterium sp. 8H]MBC2851229.1 chorismate synthase [Cetobacterium sp. 8H]